jgi:phosphonate transport system substrate-binding protein
MKTKRIATGITLLFILLFSSSGYSDTYTFGIVPQQSATKLARNWIPIIKHLEKETGLKIKFATAPNIPEFEKRLNEGLYDIAYMNPYHYTVFSKTPGYRAFAKQSEKKIKGIIVVRSDSNIQGVKELDGREIAFPAPAAFAATLLVQAHLKRNNINFSAKYVSSHDSVYRTVSQSLVPAGGGIVRTLEAMDPLIRENLKILWISDGFTPHAFAYHPRIPESQVRSITNALLMLNAKDNSPLLQSINFRGIETASDDDWNDVRALSIEKNIIDNQKEPSN